MKNYFKNTSGIKEVGAGVISGILTELICQILFETKYSIIMKNGELILTPITLYPMKAKVFLAFLTFILIWFVLFLLLYLLQFIHNRLCRVKRPIFKKSSIIQTYFEVKTSFLSIKHSIDDSSVPPELYWKELAQCVDMLFKVFCKNPSKMKSTVRNAFNYTDQPVPKLIFPYEFAELISQIKELINQISFNSPQFNNNKLILFERLNQLSDLPDRLQQKKP